MFRDFLTARLQAAPAAGGGGAVAAIVGACKNLAPGPLWPPGCRA